MKLHYIIPLLLLGCDIPQYHTTDSKTEPATVTKTFFTASHTDVSATPNMDGGIDVDTTHVPAQFGVMFRCQHGEFCIQGSKDRHADLWKRMSAGDKVVVHYKEIYRYTKKATNFYDFDFIDAVKETKPEIDL